MLKYIAETIDRLGKLKDGMEKNPESWKSQEQTPAATQAIIDGLNSVAKEVDDLQAQVSSKLATARTTQTEADKYAGIVESLAIGLEKGSQEKLNEYGIKLRKAPSKKSAPTLPLHPSLQDDTDGEGFIVSTNFDPDADMYEWEKGVSSDPTKTDSVPPLKFFKTTKKTSFVDDDVVKGVRVFYRARSTNAAGAGPWSEAVSRVQ